MSAGEQPPQFEIDKLPRFENIPFNPERDSSYTPEAETIEAKEKFQPAYFELCSRQNRGETSDIPLLGQLIGKMALRAIEGVPRRQQETIIRDLNEDRISTLRTQRHLNGGDIFAGFMGEFATGVLLTEADLFIDYPQTDEDLFRGGDLKTYGPGHRPIHIQSKTIALPENVSHRNLGTEIPIFSCLSTNKDISRFGDEITGLTGVNPEKTAKLAEYASWFYREAQSHGFIPIICLLGSPAMGESDISMATARPSPFVEAQAQKELSAIKEQLRLI